MGRSKEGDRRPSEETSAVLERRLKEIKEIVEKLWCERCKVPFGSMLSDRDIKRLIEQRRIIVEPLPDLENLNVLGTCKIDLRLGARVKMFDNTKLTHIDLTKPVPDEYLRVIDLREIGKLIVHPNEVIIAETIERVILPDDIIGRIEGKSSLARRGISVEAAPLFDAGWEGTPVLEIHNIGGTNVVAHYGILICAMSFFHLSSPTLRPFSERSGEPYANQEGARI